jgi:hypothetical protein
MLSEGITMPDTVELGETARHGAPGGLSDLLERDCDRPDVRKPGSRPERRNRSRLNGWAFGQLGQFVRSEATLKGMPIVAVDPHNALRLHRRC